MKFLLDTCVVSELKRTHPHAGVRAYLLSLDSAATYLSAVTIGEIAKGIVLLADGPKKSSLTHWLNGLESGYGDRLLPVTAEVARQWGELCALSRLQGAPMPAVDALIAATARHHGLHLVTRNVADFAAAGVRLINPWEAG